MSSAELRSRWQRLARERGLERFLHWWLGELADFVPALSGAAKLALERRVLLQFSGSQLVFYRLAHGLLAEAGRLELASLSEAGQKQAVRAELKQIEHSPSAVVLCLAPSQVLRRNLNLPLATEENLRQVLAFEMDRHTPFRAEQVHYAHRLTRGEQQLEVALVVTPRENIDQPLRQLASWDVEVVAVSVADEAGAETAVDLLPAEKRPLGKSRRLSRVELVLGGGAALLLGVALILPIWQKREMVLALQPLVGKAHQQVDKAEALRRQRDNLLGEYNYLLNKKRERPPMVAVLDDVTRVLPNDTWVQQFDVKGKEVQIQGETASSSKLVALFEQSKTLHGASFRAPLTKGMSENSERFQLAAETRPLPQTETEIRIPLPPPALPTALEATPPVAADKRLPTGEAVTAPVSPDKDKTAKPTDLPAETKPAARPGAIPPGSRT